jgi:hypothetical protein
MDQIGVHMHFLQIKQVLYIKNLFLFYFNLNFELTGLGLCDSPPKLSGPRAPILALMASGGCARVPSNLTRLSSSPTGTHHPKDLPHNRYITVITFDTHTLEIERKTFTKYTLHSRTQVLQGRKRCIYYKS